MSSNRPSGHFRLRENRDAHSGLGYSPWSPNAGDRSTATLQTTTLPEDRTPTTLISIGRVIRDAWLAEHDNALDVLSGTI